MFEKNLENKTHYVINDKKFTELFNNRIIHRYTSYYGDMSKNIIYNLMIYHEKK